MSAALPLMTEWDVRRVKTNVQTEVLRPKMAPGTSLRIVMPKLSLGLSPRDQQSTVSYQAAAAWSRRCALRRGRGNRNSSHCSDRSLRRDRRSKDMDARQKHATAGVKGNPTLGTMHRLPHGGVTKRLRSRPPT